MIATPGLSFPVRLPQLTDGKGGPSVPLPWAGSKGEAMNDQARGDRPRNPHFDDLRQVWSDQWSGEYVPPHSGYWTQFNEKWALWKDNYVSQVMPYGMRDHFAGPSAEWLDYNTASFVEKIGGSFNLDRPFERSFFRDGTILDIACGL